MKIYIPTMQRVGKQFTLQELHRAGVSCTLVVPEAEVDAHQRRFPKQEIVAVPESVQGIAATRQHIMTTTTAGKVLMLDDDLTFSVRRHDERDKFLPCSPADTLTMLRDVERLLDDYVHGGIAMREGANRETAAVRHCCRMARAIAYDVETYLKSGADFRNSTVMDDFEVTLFLLTRGYESAVLNSYVQNQRGSGTEGGAATYRTLEMHAAAARKLAERYPRFVKTVQKKTVTAWGGQERTDVIVQWKRAYEYGVNTRGAAC